MKKIVPGRKSFLLTFFLFLSVFLFSPHLIFAIPVNVELVLLQDVSGSMSNSDFNLQRSGYENAFRSQSVLSAIEKYGNIAVTLVYWASSQQVAVDWTHIYDEESSNQFANAIANTTRPTSVGFATGLTDAINMGAGLYANNGYEGRKNVMDVSGDGAETVRDNHWNMNCISCQDARDNALSGDVNTINALWIDDRNFFGDDAEDMIDATLYGQRNVIGGPGAFSIIADGFDDFEGAILTKIEREISPVHATPEPGTIFLFGCGLMGMGCLYRRKENK